MKKLDYFTVKPNLKQIYGKKVNKDTVFEDATDDGSVKQKFENLTLTTELRHENEQGEIKVVENSTLVVTVPENTVLLWSEYDGWFVPSAQVCTLDELKDEIDGIKDIYEEGSDDTKGNESQNA